MAPSTFNVIINNTNLDFNQYEYVSLDDVISQAEFQEWLSEVENEIALDELELLSEDV